MLPAGAEELKQRNPTMESNHAIPIFHRAFRFYLHDPGGLGIIFFAHGAQKVLGWYGGHGLKGTAAFFNSMGMPLPIAYLVCLLDFLSGIGLLIGFLARLCGLAVVAIMLGAIAMVHLQHGFFLNAELKPGQGNGIEYNLALIAMGLAVLIEGAGAFSIDRWLVY